MNFESEIEYLTPLVANLVKTKELGEKLEILLNNARVCGALASGIFTPFLLYARDLSAKIALFSLAIIDQHEIILQARTERVPFSKEKCRSLISHLLAIDRFYTSIGGIVGYHLRALNLLLKNRETSTGADTKFSQVEGKDLSQLTPETIETLLAGITMLKEVAEIYPIGGLGSRLNLIGKSGEPLPAACLPFCGRTLLDGLIRDVQAKEFLYYRLYGKQTTIPIALMTSMEKRNTQKIRSLCERRNWFGRPRESYFIFPQISVPVVTEDGKWSMKSPYELNLQPGGHGALWKAAEERGVFFWLQSQEKKYLLIRQINNPISGTDYGLLALLGYGKKEDKSFGFASCHRLSHAAEGVLVLVEEEGIKRLSNIEYTDFKRYGIEDLPMENGDSYFPANTNILYANMEHILPIIKKNPLPGLILNMKNREPFLCPQGLKKELLGGRLESMMQNISDALTVSVESPLPTFVTYGERKKTISACKKSFDGSLLETPEGAFYDLLWNGHDLLKNECGASVDPFCSEIEYLKQGPSTMFLYHPALGPLYCLIKQKIRGGSFKHGSEMQLEIADFYAENLSLNGSFLVVAKNLLGHRSQEIIRYSHMTGKCFLKNVTIKNKGINRKETTSFWKNQIKRHEMLKLTLQGHSEFFAESVIFEGDHEIVVPDGERWIARQSGDGTISYQIEKPNWAWRYSLEGQELASCLVFYPNL